MSIAKLGILVIKLKNYHYLLEIWRGKKFYPSYFLHLSLRQQQTSRPTQFKGMSRFPFPTGSPENKWRKNLGLSTASFLLHTSRACGGVLGWPERGKAHGWASQGRGVEIVSSTYPGFLPLSPAQLALHRPLRVVPEILLQVALLRLLRCTTPYPKGAYNSLLYCAGYGAGLPACLFQRRIGLAVHRTKWKSGLNCASLTSSMMNTHGVYKLRESNACILCLSGGRIMHRTAFSSKRK